MKDLEWFEWFLCISSHSVDSVRC